MIRLVDLTIGLIAAVATALLERHPHPPTPQRRPDHKSHKLRQQPEKPRQRGLAGVYFCGDDWILSLRSAQPCTAISATLLARGKPAGAR
jgi:hypothetical protein